MRRSAAHAKQLSLLGSLVCDLLGSLVERDIGVGLLGRLLDDLDERLAVGVDALDLGDDGRRRTAATWPSATTLTVSSALTSR